MALRFLFLTLAVSACGGAASPQKSPQVSKSPSVIQVPPEPFAFEPSQEFATLATLRDTAGRVVGTHEGPTVAIVFASWCEPCRQEIALLERIQKERSHIRVIGVNAYEDFEGRSDQNRMLQFVAQYPFLRVVVDKEAFTALGAPKKVPSLYVFNRHGELRTKFLREERDTPTEEELRGAITSAEMAQSVEGGP